MVTKRKNLNNQLDASTAAVTLILKLVLVLTVAIVAALGIASVFVTYVLAPDWAETLNRASVLRIAVSIFASIMFAILGIRILSKTQLSNPWKVRVICATVTFMMSLIWSLAANFNTIGDSEILTILANQMCQGIEYDYGLYYLDHYPYQAGYLSFLYVVAKIFGAGNYFACRFFNMICAALLVVVISRITQLISKDEKTANIAAIICTAFLPLAFLTHFIYGNIPGLFFSLLAVEQTMKMEVEREREREREVLRCLLGT